MPQAFISYARHDEDAAKRLANELARRGVQVTSIDSLVSPGDSWVTELQNAIANSDLFLLLVSPQSESSPWIATETAFAVSKAQEGRLRVVPVLLSRNAEPPPMLQHVQGIELYDQERSQRQMDALLESLSTESERKREQTAEDLGAQLQYLRASREALEKEIVAQAHRRAVWSSTVTAAITATAAIATAIAGLLSVPAGYAVVRRWGLAFGLGALASTIAFLLAAWIRRRLSAGDPREVRK